MSKKYLLICLSDSNLLVDRSFNLFNITKHDFYELIKYENVLNSLEYLFSNLLENKSKEERIKISNMLYDLNSFIRRNTKNGNYVFWDIIEN